MTGSGFRYTFSFAIAATATAIALTEPTPTLSETSRDLRVIDGDTFVLRGERVRVWGLDCPERGTPAGDRATQVARAILEPNRVMIAERKGTSYNRIVARVLVQRTSRAEFFTFDFACYMIQQGVCREWTHYSNNFYRSCNP